MLILSAGQIAPQPSVSQLACASLAVHQNNPAWMLLGSHAYAQRELPSPQPELRVSRPIATSSVSAELLLARFGQFPPEPSVSQLACASLAVHQNNPAWTLLGSHAYAQPEGDEFLVNEVVGGDQIKPYIIPLQDGRFVVTGRIFTPDSSELLLSLHPNATDARRMVVQLTEYFECIHKT